MKKHKGKKTRRTLKSLCAELSEVAPDIFPESGVAAIESGHRFAEFHPFTVLVKDDGWELADGDPVCNWCFNTFFKSFDHDTPAKKIVKFARKKKAQLDAWEQQRKDWRAESESIRQEVAGKLNEKVVFEGVHKRLQIEWLELTAQQRRKFLFSISHILDDFASEQDV